MTMHKDSLLRRCPTIHRRALTLALTLNLLAVPALSQGAIFNIVNADGPGEGFNDPTPVAPVGGNTGTTLGQQRQIAFAYAAGLWGTILNSGQAIDVIASMDPLPGDANSGVLGAAGPTNFYANFQGASLPNTWHPTALAEKLSGLNLSQEPGQQDLRDIVAQFNSDVDTDTVLQGSKWYYGLDGNPPEGDVDFATVVSHEFGHGLGFLTLVDLDTGALGAGTGLNDVYTNHLAREGATPSAYPLMTNAQRLAANVSNAVVWTGPNVNANSDMLDSGVTSLGVRIYSPNPVQPGSSISHFDLSLSPDETMEPFYAGPNHNGILTAFLFQDIGWGTVNLLTSGVASSVLPTSRSVQVNATAAVFATIANASSTTAAYGCKIAPATNIPASFSFQATNPLTNEIIAPANRAFDIPPSGAQSFVLTFQPTAAFNPTDVEFEFACANTPPAAVTAGVNTLLLSASVSPVPDVVALAATPEDPGIVNIPGNTGTGFFSVATVNVGAGATITAQASTGTAALSPQEKALPVVVNLCETNPVTGVCISALGPTVTTQIGANETPTFAVFVTGQGQDIAFDPANNRVFVEFVDAARAIRGSTSVAVRTR